MGLLLALLVGLAALSTAGDPDAVDLGRALAAPAPGLPLGADHLGRDVAARLAAGTGRSLLVLLLFAATAVPLGLALGLAAAWSGPVARAVGFGLRLGAAVPAFVLAFAVTAIVGLSPLAAGLALGLAAAAQYGLLTAAHARACLREGYVHAAGALGAGGMQIMRRHVLPAVLGPLRARLGAGLARCVVAYAGLAFVGLGADTATPDWGAMAWEYRAALFEAPRLLIAPVLMITVLALICHVLIEASPAARRGPMLTSTGVPSRCARREGA